MSDEKPPYEIDEETVVALQRRKGDKPYPAHAKYFTFDTIEECLAAMAAANHSQVIGELTPQQAQLTISAAKAASKIHLSREKQTQADDIASVLRSLADTPPYADPKAQPERAASDLARALGGTARANGADC